MPRTVVHKAAPRAVHHVVSRLRDSGVDAQAVDDPNLIALLVSFGTYRVRISVPEEEADEARRVLDDWDREAAPLVEELTRRVQRQFLLASVVSLVIVGGLVLLGASWGPTFLAMLVSWVVAVVILGAIDRRRDG